MNQFDSIRICRADYANSGHSKALVGMLDEYARDPMGGGKALSQFARFNVVKELAKIPQAFSVLAFDGEGDELPVGLVNCLQGFSTFACRPLINVHDLTVSSGYRGQRIADRMLTLVESIARERGACKLTLEVLSGNAPAMRLYTRAGFAHYELDPVAGQAGLMQKWLAY
jgi:ribosomal protein S18 acetylase RimI-like enzyme